MNIRLVKIFVAVCDAGSVTGAAEKLYTTQPAVTLAIQALERETGLKLFDRLSRRLHLTESGGLFLGKVRQLLALWDDLERNAFTLEQKAKLRIGSCITIACFLLPQIMENFQTLNRASPTTIQVASAEKVMDMLRADDIDIALYEGPPPPPPYVSSPFSSYRLLPVCAPEHPFAGKTDIPLKSFLSQKLLLREKGSAIRDVFDSFLRLKQMSIEPEMISVNSQALICAVQSNMGVSILPDATVAEAVERGKISTFSVKGMRLKNENHIVVHVDKHRTEAMRAFMACVSEKGVVSDHDIKR